MLLGSAKEALMRNTLLAMLLALAALPACKSNTNERPAADNTARNDQAARSPSDPATAAKPTADNAVNSDADRELTQSIRKAVMDDGSLSTNAHNCKIIVQDGTVTLSGPVASEAERTKLEQLATAQAGGRKIVNQLEVIK
jgi:hyperosmotically inducible periplasmic protein